MSKRTVRLSVGALFGALLALMAHAAIPVGGHDYLRGIAALLARALGSVVSVVCVVSLGTHLAWQAIQKRRDAKRSGVKHSGERWPPGN